ncbi:hypothetical protein A8B98_22675 [Hymenobacter sp. UV11]|nr:type VI secretion system protein TssR domain-containing protein [Hymenobacter sp. UV11]TDN38643.1 hypothetical protein A8B98_22675 [Hymenobacter sp. UV11]
MACAARAQLPLFATIQSQPAGRAQNGHTPWIVYSDRANNPTYQRPGLDERFKQMRFREAFYVLAERQGFLELIRYDPTLGPGPFYARRLLKNRKAAVYYGWVPKSRLLLDNRVAPTLYCAALANWSMLRDSAQMLRHDSLKLAASPDFTGATTAKVKLYDLVYIYKRSDSGQSVLLGRADWFPADSAQHHLLGWAPLVAVQSLGQGQFLEQKEQAAGFDSPPLYGPAQQVLAKQANSLERLRAFSTVAWSSTLPRLPILSGEQRVGNSAGWHLGVLTELLSEKNSVRTVNGGLLTVAQATAYRQQARRFNLVYVIEGGAEMRPFWGELVNTMQTTASRWHITPEFDPLRLGAVFYHQARSTQDSLPLTTQPRLLINQVIQHQSRQAATGRSLRQAIAQALTIFCGHEGENNVVIIVGINGDTSDRDLAAGISNSLLQATGARFLSFQVQAKAPLDLVANNFVLQSQVLLSQSAEAGSVTKQSRLVSPESLVVGPPVLLGPGPVPYNVYQLAFPKQSMVPGWVLFPAKNQYLPFSLLQSATDSLLAQMRADVQQTQDAIDHAFLAMLPLGGQFHARVSQVLTAQGEQAARGPTPALVALRQYPFYSSVYTRPLDSLAAFRQVRCVTPDTHAVIGQWLDKLAADDVEPTKPVDRQRLASFFKQLKDTRGRALADTSSLAQVVSAIVGLPVKHPLLRQLSLKTLRSPTSLSADTWQQLLAVLRAQRAAYYLVPTIPSQRFTSNGQTYYWLREDLFQ